MSNDISIVDLDVEDMKMGSTFDNEYSAILSINKWSGKAFCPLSKSRYQKPKEDDVFNVSIHRLSSENKFK